MTKVKICGITDSITAMTCIEEGADFLGFNFVKSSKRYCEVKRASEIIKETEGLRKKRGVAYVGIFQNADIEEVNEIADALNLDFVQLHGEESDSYVKRVKYKVIKYIAIAQDSNIQKLEINKLANKNLKYILLDRKMQGKGNIINLKLAKSITQQFPTFFAGGLTPENVRSIIQQVQPFAVDVAGGVESNGKKDQKKIKEFIKNAKGGINCE